MTKEEETLLRQEIASKVLTSFYHPIILRLASEGEPTGVALLKEMESLDVSTEQGVVLLNKLPLTLEEKVDLLSLKISLVMISREDILLLDAESKKKKEGE